MNVFSLIPPPWGTVLKIAGPLLLAVGLYGTGYLQGSHHQKVVTQVKTLKSVETQYKYVVQQQPGKDRIIYRNQTVHDEAIAEIPSTVTDSTLCRLGPDAIRVLNSVRSLPTEP